MLARTVMLMLSPMVITAAASAQSHYLLVCGAYIDGVIRYDGDTGQPFDHLVGKGISPLWFPPRMTIGPDGSLYVSSHNNDMVLRYNAQTGEYLDVFIARGSGGLDGPWGIYFHGDFAYVASQNNNLILKYDASTGLPRGAFETVPELDTPRDFDVGPDGNIYVSSYGNDRVLRYTTDGEFDGTFVESGSGGLSGPNGLVFLESGVLLVVSKHNDKILEYAAVDGHFLGRFDRVESGLDSPNAMLLGPDGLIYVAAGDNARVVRYETDGTPDVFIPDGSGGLIHAAGLAFGPHCPGDTDADGDADVADLLTVLGSWGACPTP